MLQNRNVAIDSFIQFTANGLSIADYDQVQAALIAKYKEVYGYDIDLSNTTADGIFVNNLALIINNILQSFKTLYNNLNINTASGVYLDTLCRLSNVTRLQATKSTAQLSITSTVNTKLYNGTIFIDTTGNEWVYSGNDIDITANSSAVPITVTCTEFGPIKADENSITQTLEATYLTVKQPAPANVGRNIESDSELRARRDQSNGAQGNTVLESLVGALLEVTGIDDVQIINNNTNTVYTSDDTTSVQAHSVYIIIRQSQNVVIDNSTIGNIIYNKMTAGISTTKFTGTNGTAGEYSVSLVPSISDITNTVYWKNATPIHPTITVKINKGRNYTPNTTQNIGNAILNYLNNIKLSNVVSANDIMIAATYADSTAAYTINSVDVSQALNNDNTYYYYTKFSVSGYDTDPIATLTFSA